MGRIEVKVVYHLGKLLKLGPEKKQAVLSAAELVRSARDALAPVPCGLLTWSVVTLLKQAGCFWREVTSMNGAELLSPLRLSGPYAFLRFGADHSCLSLGRSSLCCCFSPLRHHLPFDEAGRLHAASAACTRGLPFLGEGVWVIQSTGSLLGTQLLLL